jgi:uncharacterized protein YjdB
MKKMITKTTLLFILSVFFAVSVKAQSVSGVALLGADSIVLGVDSAMILTAIVSPHNAADKSVVWMTTDKLIADTVSVVEDTICRIKGISVGEAKIIVMTKEGNFRDTCVVKVIIPVDSVRLKDDSLTMILGRDTTLISKIYPVEPKPTNGEMLWTSSDPSVVDIINVTDDSICSLKALKLGVAAIFVSSVDGVKKDSCVVTVTALPVEGLTLSHDSIKYMRLESDTILTVRVDPFGETNDSVKWTSADHTVVEVTSSGYDTVCTIRAKGIGKTYIYAVSIDDSEKKDSCFVNVVGVPVEGLSLNVDSLDLTVHTDTTLIARITPPDATNDSIRWTSGDSTIIDIISPESLKNDTTCTVVANKSGGAYIYAQTFEGGFKDSCWVSVIVPVDSVVLDLLAIRINLKEDTVGLLKAKVYPDSATCKSPLTWVNKDERIARIDSVVHDTLCYMKALSPGVDTLYVMMIGGVMSEFCYVTVDPRLADSVRIAKNDDLMENDTLQLGLNGSIALQAAIYPSNVTNDTIILTSSDPEILRIDSLPEGVYIRALREGAATLYAVAADNSREKDSCIVKVRTVPATGIRLNKDTLYVYEGGVDSLIATVSPLNATDKTIIWRSYGKNEEVLDIIQVDNDSVYKFKALKADTVLIHAYAREEESGIKDSCVVIVKSETGNEPVDEESVIVYVKDHRLYVNTAKAETVYVYSSNGSLALVKRKAEGSALFDLKTEDKILFVRGGSGWTRKTVNL